MPMVLSWYFSGANFSPARFAQPCSPLLCGDGAAGAGHDQLGGLQEGVNDWKQPGWRGPVLPSHGHRIQFKLYALDDEVHLGNKVRLMLRFNLLGVVIDLRSN